MHWRQTLPLCLAALLAGGPTLADEPFEGLTLFSSLNSSNTIMVDMTGTTVKIWHGASAAGQMAYWFPDNSILRASQTQNSYFGGGGAGGRIQRIDASDDVVWDFTFSNSTHQQHHDIHPMPDGNVLLVCWERKTAAEAQAMGRTSISGYMWPTKIAEVEPSGSSGGTVVWEWHMWDHLIQDVDSSKPNYGVVADHPELLDINLGTLGGGGGDWEHINAIDYNPELDQVVISSHTLHEFYVIDHSTTTAEAASHSGGNCGQGGDLLYRWGNPANYDRGTSADKVFYVCHGVNWIDAGMPGAGNILILNNGDRSGSANDYSTAVEITPPLLPDGNYAIEAGEPYGPASPTWSYSDPGTFYSQHLGGCYRLPNGNTLITEGTTGFVFEVSAAGQVLWDHDISGELASVMRYSTAAATVTPTRTPAPPTATPAASATPTWTPTLTATPPPGSTSTPVPSATPTPIPGAGMTLFLEDDDLAAGDRLHLSMLLESGAAELALDAYVLLDVYGQYWSWPDWVPLDQGLGSRRYQLAAGGQVSEDLLDFAWPEVGGSASGLYFHGAAFLAGTYDLIGGVQSLTFQYR